MIVISVITAAAVFGTSLIVYYGRIIFGQAGTTSKVFYPGVGSVWNQNFYNVVRTNI